MLLELNPDQLQAIKAHAESTYPEECCGLLLGQLRAQADETIKVVVETLPTENVWSPEVEKDVTALGDQSTAMLTKANRYWIAPEAMLQAMKYGRDRDLEIIGIYHSHPDRSAIPSACDRAYAWPHYSYLIVSVQQGQAQDWQSWSLNEKGDFQPEIV